MWSLMGIFEAINIVELMELEGSIIWMLCMIYFHEGYAASVKALEEAIRFVQPL